MKSPTILVVEDNRLNMKLVRSLLHLSGYQVLEAEDAEKAIQMASTHLPDLILMDIQLPGMDGLEATRIIKSRKELKDIPVVALTSYAMPGDEERAREAFCSGYITKPIDTRKFIETINRFLISGAQTIPAISENRHPGKPRILVVDDDPLNIKLLKAKLPAEKFETLSAANGKEAVELALNELPDCILLDIMMPEIDGFTVCRRLKENPATHEIPIILVTALEGLEDKIRGLEAGADEFLNKPVNTIELLARINSLLRLKQYRERLSLRTHSEKNFVPLVGPLEKMEDSPYRPLILLVEDNEKDILIYKRFFADDQYEFESVTSGEAALERLQAKAFDLVLLDVLLPGIDGFEVCSQLKNMPQTRDLQVILITCLPDLENKIKGIEQGADDYLIKPVNRQELHARMKVLLSKKRCMDILRRNYESALNSAINDSTTTLYNQAFFKKFFEQELRRASRQKYPVSLVFMDIDNFKQINDSLGHLAGDHILSELGPIIKKNIREIDLPARYGGDEFALVFPYTDREEAILLTERLQEAIKSRKFFQTSGSAGVKLTVSIGIAFYPSQGSTPDEVIRKADLALYEAKKEGKNRYHVSS